MSTILYISTAEPRFPSSDQHPDAVRYQVGSYWVDALDGEPSAEEVEASLTPSGVTPGKNGVALDTRERKTAKDEAAAFAKVGDFEAAILKLSELIP